MTLFFHTLIQHYEIHSNKQTIMIFFHNKTKIILAGSHSDAY
jgi:hypothetical protein